MSQKLLHSASPIIPAVQSGTLEEFTKKLEFARSVGSAHFDVIDGDFVHGEALSIDQWPEKINVDYCEVHLMVRRPMEYLEQIANRGIGRAIVHIESEFNLDELQQKARELDILLGFAVNPDTDLLKVKPLLNTGAYIQVMGVTPGKANQEMIELTPMAINYIYKSTSKQMYISVDGGIRLGNIPALQKAGAQYFASTSAIYGEGDWQQNYDALVAVAKGETQ